MHPNNAPRSVRQQIVAWIEHLDGELLERQVAVRLAVLAPLSGQHLLLLGPPGTAKTRLARRACEVFYGARFFPTLLTKFSTPEDVFGPLSLPELEQGRYRRLVDRYLPKADVALVDEIYKANASILNALLSVLNERVFHNGDEALDVPLLAMLAASNEVPEPEDGLDALDDRLLLRVRVEPLQEPKAVLAMLQQGRRTTTDRRAPPPIALAAVEALRARARKVELDDEVGLVLLELRRACQKQALVVSDRRWCQAVDVLATCAAIDAEQRIGLHHLGVLRHALWRRPADQPKAVDALVEAISAARPSGVTASTGELARSLSDQKTALDQLAQRVRPSAFYRGFTDYDAQEGEGALREAIHKVRETVVALHLAVEARRRALQGPNPGLWNPFWTDLLPRLTVGPSVGEVQDHPVWRELPRWPALAGEWQEARRLMDEKAPRA